MTNLATELVHTPEPEVARFLERLELFQGVPPGQLRDLAALATTRTASRRHAVWSAGDPADAVYLVRSGVVRVAQIAPDARELTHFLVGRRAVIGLDALVPDVVRNNTAIAHEDAVLYGLPGPTVRGLSERNATLATRLLQVSEQRRRVAERRAFAIAYGTAPARVAALLLDLAGDFGVSDSRGTIVNLRLTHKEIAALVGATRETVSTVVVALRNAGCIHTEQKRIVLLDRDALARIAAGRDTLAPA